MNDKLNFPTNFEGLVCSATLYRLYCAVSARLRAPQRHADRVEDPGESRGKIVGSNRGVRNRLLVDDPDRTRKGLILRLELGIPRLECRDLLPELLVLVWSRRRVTPRKKPGHRSLRCGWGSSGQAEDEAETTAR